MFKLFNRTILSATVMITAGLNSAKASAYDQQEHRSAVFSNPCYKQYPGIEKKSGMQTVEEITVYNGDMLNFGSGVIIGKTIRAASSVNRTPNPLGLTHSGIAIVESPKYIFGSVLEMEKDGRLYNPKQPLTEKARKEILSELMTKHRSILAMTSDPGILASFSLESDGSASEVLKGIMPHVHIHCLENTAENYGGNVYIRHLNSPVPIESSRLFLNETIGRPYEVRPSGIVELLKSPLKLNKRERTENLFCSEMAALFYRKTGVLSIQNVSNIIPEQFGSGSGEYDLLRGKASVDVPLKLKYNFSQRELDGKTSCGFAFRTLFSFCTDVDVVEE